MRSKKEIQFFVVTGVCTICQRDKMTSLCLMSKWAEKIVRKLIPSTDHVFDRYWSGDILKDAFTEPTGITSKKFWTKPKKGTVMRLVKNPKTGKYENVYIEP